MFSEGADAASLTALPKAVEAEGMVYEMVAPKIGGVTLASRKVAAKREIDGGPSVLFGAVRCARCAGLGVAGK